MTQKDKELLLKYLCSALPYGVIVQDRNGVHTLTSGNTEFIDLFNGKCNIKPYLRPMSSMTEEEEKELLNLNSGIVYRKDIINNVVLGVNYKTDAIDWLNAHHFDYRGLIEKGLALEAPEEMYN